MSSPLITVVMPSWNSARTLSVAIRSVLNQTINNFELIICNDASEDDTLEVLSSFSDSRINILNNNFNLGEGKTRDRAISEARGKWLAVIDSDDAWVPDRLEKLISAIGSEDNAMVFDDIIECHDTPSGLVRWKQLRGSRAFGINTKNPSIIPFSNFITSQRLLIKPLFPTSIVRSHNIFHTDHQ